MKRNNPKKRERMMFFLSFWSFPIVYIGYIWIIIMNDPKKEGKMNMSVHSFI